MLKNINSEGFINTLLAILLGVAIGCLSLKLQVKEDNQPIYYVSQNELVQFEKERLTQTGGANLFDGKAALATEIIDLITKAYMDKGYKVIFTKDVVKGVDIYSLSKQVHEETIKQLNQIKEEQKTMQGSDESSKLNTISNTEVQETTKQHQINK